MNFPGRTRLFLRECIRARRARTSAPPRSQRTRRTPAMPSILASRSQPGRPGGQANPWRRWPGRPRSWMPRCRAGPAIRSSGSPSASRTGAGQGALPALPAAPGVPGRRGAALRTLGRLGRRDLRPRPDHRAQAAAWPSAQAPRRGHRCARCDLQARDLRQRVENFVGDAVAEVVGLRVTTHVDEWQHGNRPGAYRLAGIRCTRAQDEVVGQQQHDRQQQHCDDPAIELLPYACVIDVERRFRFRA